MLLQILQKKCELTEIKFRKPVLDVKTRWNSTLNMLRSAQHLFPAIILLVQSEKALRNHQINHKDLQDLDAIINFLGKLEKITLHLSSQKNNTMVELSILYNGLLIHLQNYEKNEYLGFLAKDMKNALIEVKIIYMKFLKFLIYS